MAGAMKCFMGMGLFFLGLILLTFGCQEDGYKPSQIECQFDKDCGFGKECINYVCRYSMGDMDGQEEEESILEGEDAELELTDQTEDEDRENLDLESPLPKISAGGYHTCGIERTGEAKCWGKNQYGQLGDGTEVNSSLPVSITGLGNKVQAIDASLSHSCALMESGEVLCWGDGSNGNLGDGTRNSSSKPVLAGKSFLAGTISVGEEHSCAITNGKRLHCWGENASGQIGNGTYSDALFPFEVKDLQLRNVAVAAGANHTCSINSIGYLYCWGDNESCQLGDGTDSSKTKPVWVSQLKEGVKVIAAGSYFNCAVTLSGSAYCWGANDNGQLGNGMAGYRYREARAAKVQGLTGNVRSVTAGEQHACALMEDGTVFCWGKNSSGQLGIGAMVDSVTARKVKGLPEDITEINAGNWHTCAMSESGDAYCWGKNTDGCVGWLEDRTEVPIREVIGLSGEVRLVSAGKYHACAVQQNGVVYCWGSGVESLIGLGYSDSYTSAQEVTGLNSPVFTVAVGLYHSCALTDAGDVYCWGDGSYCQQGNNPCVDSSVPKAVSSLGSGVKNLVAGFYHNCVVMENGSVKCWGNNEYGQLGNNSTKKSGSPVDVQGLGSGVKSIAAWGSRNCVLLDSGAVKCWGYSHNDPDDGKIIKAKVAVSISGFAPEDNVKVLSTGPLTTCVVLETGSVKCWNGFDEMPVEIVGLGGPALSVSVSNYETCALMETGSVKCWNKEDTTPLEKENLSSGVRAVHMGETFGCAILDKGSVTCWGDSRYGQLGDGVIGNLEIALSPIRVVGFND